jgi:AcrR family transcriptional regulator
MTSPGDETSTRLARRPHDAAASKQALLEAAGQVFDEVGYDRATTREIGERAGVDPAMIARYFESKEGLFLAAIAAGALEEELDFDPQALLAFLLERWDERGHSPISRALASPALSEQVRTQVSTLVREHLVDELSEKLRGRGVAEPRLRAELLVAIAVGVAMTRANGTLETLAAAPRRQILDSIAPLIEALGSA